MEPNSIYKRYPLVTMVAAFLVVDVALTSVQGQDLGHQVMSTSLAAACAICLVGLLVPRSLRGFRFRIKGSKGRFESAFDTAIAPQLLVVAAVGGALTFASIQTGLEDVFRGELPLDNGDIPHMTEVLVLVALLCAVTGLFEEGFFRGLVVPCAYERSKREINRVGKQVRTARQSNDDDSAVSSRSRSIGDSIVEDETVPFEENPAFSAALFSSLLFGLLHVSGAGGAFAETASQGEIAMLALAVNGVLKFLQASMFGFCMASLFLECGSIWLPALLHSAFDMLYLGPILVSTGTVPETYLTGSWADMVALAITIVLLLPPCVKSARWLARGVIPYEQFRQEDIR